MTFEEKKKKRFKTIKLWNCEIVKKYKIRIFNEIVTQTTQSLSINLHIYLQI